MICFQLKDIIIFIELINRFIRAGASEMYYMKKVWIVEKGKRTPVKAGMVAKAKKMNLSLPLQPSLRYFAYKIILASTTQT